MKIIKLAVAACTLLLLVNGAVADMFVDRSIVTFEAGSSSRQDVKVSNSGNENIYVQVEVFQVNNPGEKDEDRIQITDPKALKLIATPSKLIVPPNGQKLVRLVNLKTQNDLERVYRINITPILPPLSDEESQLRIVVAYQVLAIIQADQPASNLSSTRKGTKVLFENTGNSNVLLSDGKQCEPTSTANCTELPSKRLYAGNTWELDIEQDAPVTFTVDDVNGSTKLRIP